MSLCQKFIFLDQKGPVQTMTPICVGSRGGWSPTALHLDNRSVTQTQGYTLYPCHPARRGQERKAWVRGYTRSMLLYSVWKTRNNVRTCKSHATQCSVMHVQTCWNLPAHHAYKCTVISLQVSNTLHLYYIGHMHTCWKKLSVDCSNLSLMEESAVSLSLSESLRILSLKKLSDSVPLGSWLYGAGPLPEHLPDELPQPDRSFISPLRHSLL